MQILPTSIARLGFVPKDSSLSGATSASAADMFAGLLNSYKMSASAIVDDALGAPLPVKDPFSQPSTEPESSRSTAGDPMRDVKMTRDDILQLAPKLEEAGVPKTKLDELTAKADSPQGVTWGQFTHEVEQATVSKQVKKEDLSDQDRQTLASLFSHMGFSEAKAKELTDALANGRTEHVWRQVSAQLSEQGSSGSFSMSRDEMATLAKALRLPQEARDRLATLGAKVEGADLTGAGLKTMLSAVQQEVTAQKGQAEAGLQPVRQVLEQAMAQAKDKAGTAAKASPAGVRASSLLKDPQDLGAGKEDSSKVAAADAKAQASSGTPGANAAGAKPGVQPGAQPGNQANSQAGNQGAGQQNQQSSGKGAGEQTVADLGGKIRTESGANPTGASLFGLGQPGQGAQAAQARAADPQAARTQASQLLEQVESGVFKNMGQGVKQLTLELTPEGLGKLNVVLTVKGKEVQAMIKADTPEAEKMLSENLGQLKKNLEDQGLSVAKLEVQHQAAQDAGLGQQWAGGSEKHNEFQQRRDALERLRANTLLSSGGESLAQQMQSVGAEAKITQRGLDIVA
ncbi:flagellar hook-length control protein FliK [Fundidesulfovibrio agrisoli]|uniref:flagellar hook-length control protein FliK n=1 Tax=Fundidesulfovibrio agrisoli TaxID=2922717 RepID=UPI001FAB49EA|nr:flagellar hook-length control protein FliK [Fundidesulfovibrio agrisoli]